MAASSQTTTSQSTDPPACPFCGQLLLDRTAVEHLARQTAAYEAEVRGRIEAEAQLRVDAEVQVISTKLEAEAAQDLQRAADERAAEVNELNRRLEDVQKDQAATVQAEVRKQLADAAEAERTRLEQEFAKREKQLQSTLKKLEGQNTELSRRVERLSAGERGEFNEEEIVSRLIQAFPDDEINRTRRGQRGADIFQHVRFRTDTRLTEAGLIVYECKDTLHWSNGFISQVKTQARLHGTPYAVLVSRCFPRGEENLTVIDDVVVVDPGRCIALAAVMRRLVIESYRAGIVSGSQAEKTQELFRFISSTAFRQEFDSLTDALTKLDDILTRERRSHQKAWTERGRIHDALSDTVGRIDARFRCILESEPTKHTIHVVRRSSA